MESESSSEVVEELLESESTDDGVFGGVSGSIRGRQMFSVSAITYKY